MLHRPKSLAEAIQILVDDPEAKPLAGGASLVAMLNARLVEPNALVSLSCIEELRRTERRSDGTLRVGAMTRHRDVAEMPALTGTHVLLQQAAAAIANPTIRAMGTIGGSIALNDPGADYAPALFALSATVEIVSAYHTRTVAAADYFIDWYTTALEAGELVTAIHLPPAAPGVGLYQKLARVAGDFAIVSVAVVVQADEHVRAVIGGCGPRPLSLEEANNELAEGNVEAAGALLAAAADPVDDSRASAQYRRRVLPRMLARAFAQASSKALAA